MPQVQHTGREASVLAPHTAADHADDDIGIFQPPADEGRLKSVDAIEIGAEESKIAAAHALPLICQTLAQWPERQVEQRQKAIDVTPRTPHRPRANARVFRLEIARKNLF